jgi:hypothetical protein
MAFATQLDPDELLVLGDNTMVIGTAALGDDFGEIVSCSIDRDGTFEEIEATSGNLRAVLVKNARFDVQMDCLFDNTVTPPGLMDSIDLPFEGITGRVKKATIKWERGKERMLTITATSWDALEGATLYTLASSSGAYTAV